jgi:hypothetical protein
MFVSLNSRLESYKEERMNNFLVAGVAQACWRFLYANTQICKLGFDQNYYTLTLTLLAKIVLCSELP